MELNTEIMEMARRAKAASLKLGLISTAEKNRALTMMAQALISKSGYIIAQNKKDLTEAQRQNYAKVLMDRLVLNEKRIKEMSDSLLETAKLKDPVGEVLSAFKRPNGLLIKKVRVPIGVIGIVYESRPNVTSDCVGLCVKSGNAVILKGGREAVFSNRAIFKVLRDALEKTQVPFEAIQLISSIDRKAVEILLSLEGHVDLIIPRGGEALIRFVADHSRIPVIKHYKGVCHTYVSDHADLAMAYDICMNAKVQRPGVCNAMETLLVDKKIANKFLPDMLTGLRKAGVEIRGCPRTRAVVKDGVKKAVEQDWKEEYLDLILSVKVVDNLKQAISHINTYGTKHSDTIVTKDKAQAEEFLKAVDSACVYVNASTRFTDGYQFGFGAEVGISTDKIHARGPMALEELTTYKYLILGQGQIRQ